MLRLIPGLEQAEFVRFGMVHRNTYVNGPTVLPPTWQTRARPDLFFAGQVSGVEGYVESAASGLLAGINAARLALGEAPLGAAAHDGDRRARATTCRTPIRRTTSRPTSPSASCRRSIGRRAARRIARRRSRARALARSRRLAARRGIERVPTDASSAAPARRDGRPVAPAPARTATTTPRSQRRSRRSSRLPRLPGAEPQPSRRTPSAPTTATCRSSSPTSPPAPGRRRADLGPADVSLASLRGFLAELHARGIAAPRWRASSRRSAPSRATCGARALIDGDPTALVGAPQLERTHPEAPRRRRDDALARDARHVASARPARSRDPRAVLRVGPAPERARRPRPRVDQPAPGGWCASSARAARSASSRSTRARPRRCRRGCAIARRSVDGRFFAAHARGAPDASARGRRGGRRARDRRSAADAPASGRVPQADAASAATTARRCS